MAQYPNTSSNTLARLESRIYDFFAMQVPELIANLKTIGEQLKEINNILQTRPTDKL